MQTIIKVINFVSFLCKTQYLGFNGRSKKIYFRHRIFPIKYIGSKTLHIQLRLNPIRSVRKIVNE